MSAKWLLCLEMAVCGLSHQRCPVLGLRDREENQETRKFILPGGWAEVLGHAEQR